MKIIFIGTSELGVPTLIKLLDNPIHEIKAVITKEPKPQGRKLQIIPSPVEIAIKNSNKGTIPIYNCKSLKSDLKIQQTIFETDADLILVISSGFLIPSCILNSKTYKCINVHPSLLPKFRGASPLQRAILTGDEETAVTIMEMDEGLDTGDIILQEKIAIGPKTTFTELHDQAAIIASNLILRLLNNIQAISKTPQSSQVETTYAHKITKEDGRINWACSAKQIDCQIRALNPWPGTHFKFEKKDKTVEEIKILEAEIIDNDNKNENLAFGTVINENPLKVLCGSGILNILKLQRPGKQVLDIQSFQMGHKIQKGTLLK